jgi:hypothetical protein
MHKNMSSEFELRMQNFVSPVCIFVVILVGMTSEDVYRCMFKMADWKAPSNKFLIRPLYVCMMRLMAEMFVSRIK